MHDLLPRQMLRQWLALWLVLFRRRRDRAFGFNLGGNLGRTGFQFLEPQFELFDLAIKSFR